MNESTPRCPNCEQLEARVAELERRNTEALRQIATLHRLLDEARRSGKRQSAPFSKGPPKTDPKPPGRKPGDAYGLKAHRLPPDVIDEVIEAPLPSCCPDCGGPIEECDLVHQFQDEIPRKPIHRRFDIHVGRCRKCKKRVQGRHPLQTSDAIGAASAQLGPDAQAIVAHLNKDVGASYGKIRRFFHVAFGITLSRGAGAHVVLRAARRTEHAYGQIVVAIQQSVVVYIDETGWKVEALLQWLWAFVSLAAQATLYLIRDSRGFDVPCEVLGKDFRGRLGHDGWAPYDKFKKATHGQCNAHLLRRCENLLEAATRGAVRFPRAVKTLLLAGLALRDRRDAGEIRPHGLAVATGRIEARLDRLLDQDFTHEGNRKFAKHLAKHQDAVFTYLHHPDIEATDWPGEQAIRGAVVNRKVWGGNRTERGARAQEILLSVLRTCVQRGTDGIEFLSRCLCAPACGPPPALPAPTTAHPLVSLAA